MRDALINLRALPKQRDLIDHAVHLLGKNRSDFMLEAACERARAIMLDQVFLPWTRIGFGNSLRCSMHHKTPILALSA
jgi:uncharacterized protein (DUF1778 family)